MGGQEIKKALGSNIKQLRAHKQFSQAILAEEADISVAYLSKIERGIKYPKPDILSQIAEGLGVEVYVLFKTDFMLKPVPASVLNDRKKLLHHLSEVMTVKVNNTMKKVFNDFENGKPKEW